MDIDNPHQDSQPLYTSVAPSKGIALRYTVFPDRVDLVLRILNETITIPAREILQVYLVPGGIPEVLIGTLRGRYPLMGLIWGLALDTGVLGPHVLLKSASGPVRYFRFKPLQPEKFVEACNRIRTS
ncbi:MAG: hypothetical protein GY792_21155 [Gammaproteobacteria bacterium]|nr:hypothetical protein [Gammaproteobacteria bacterium]